MELDKEERGEWGRKVYGDGGDLSNISIYRLLRNAKEFFC
jgi:hypothetical protein